MAFSTDKQTLEDLKIFDRYGDDSIFQLFNRCATRGGAMVLEDMFSHPLSDAAAINKRSGIIRYFSEQRIEFPLTSGHFEAIDPYLSNTDERTRLSAHEQSVTRKLSNMIAADAETATIHKGIAATAAMLKELSGFIASSQMMNAELYCSDKESIQALLNMPALKQVWELQGKVKLTQAVMAEYDGVFRFKFRDEIQKLLRHIYLLDVYLSVARVARENGYVFPVALPAGNSELQLEGVYHPAIKNAIPNDIHITKENNVIFLTGANMAGKSTFMKSLSIAIFLAHMGFPVAAGSMRFHVLDGIYTTINLPDNLGMGASHFYAEVLRLKKVAHELGQGKRIYVMFDELFRGTNVKDAYDATIAVTTAFAERKDSIFVISTHIIEAGDVLKERCNNIAYLYLPTRMNGTRPVYTYTLEQGITNDRHGMVIINNEKILEILEAGLEKLEGKKTIHSLTALKT
jgi:DNA mismatch repair ATPase MutS